MQVRHFIWWGAIWLMVAGCEKKQEPAGSEPVSQKVTPPKPEITPLKPAPPAGPGPEVAQCEEILDRGWRAIQPAMARLQIPDPASLEAGYKRSARNFLLRCQKLAPQQRGCLAEAAHPFMAIADCQVNRGKKPSQRLYPPSLRRYVKLFEPRPLSPAEGKRLLASLQGRWVNHWKAARTRTAWNIDRRGQVSQISRVRRNKAQKKNFKISFVESGRMRVEWNPSSIQPFVFFKPDRRTFYATGNLAYGFYPVSSQKSFVVQNGGDTIFYDGGRCQVVSSTGLIVEGRCRYTKRGKDKIFKVRYQFPGRKLLNGEPRTDQRAYYPVGKFLLHESLVAAGKFQRK